MKKTYILLILVIVLAVGLRLFQLGVNPLSLDWDEASLGYNAYSLLKTGKDEYGRVWPVSIRSFGDFKPAMYTYLTIPAVAVFGLNEYAVRLPSAIMGVLTVIALYFLAKALLQFNDLGLEKSLHEPLSLLAAFLLAISPWHLQFSRVAFEANVALFFVVFGTYCFFKSINNGRWLIFSAAAFAMSFYSYHSPRLVVPLMVLGWTIFFKKQLWRQKKYIVIAMLFGGILLTPFVKDFVSSGGARLNAVTVLTPSDELKDSISRIEADRSNGDQLGALMHNRRIVYAFTVIKGYLDHFNLDFLFLFGDGPDRHHARDVGMLYIWTAPFILIGVLYLLRQKGNFPIFWWFLMSPVAAAITSGTPHAVRSLLSMPVYQLFTAFGVIVVYKQLNIKKTWQRILKFILVGVLVINGFYYLVQYYVNTPTEAAKDWQYGYKQAVADITRFDSEVDKVIMTYAYDQPYIYVLFYAKIDPDWYQKQWVEGEIQRSQRSFGKYEFRTINWEQDQKTTRTLLIGTPNEIPAAVPGIVDEIYYPNGSVALRIVKR